MNESGSSDQRTSSIHDGIIQPIPSGLNRIRTRRSTSRRDEFREPLVYGSSGPLGTSYKNNYKGVAAGRGRIINSSSRGGDQRHRVKKITRWLSSYFSPEAENLTDSIPAKADEEKPFDPCSEGLSSDAQDCLLDSSSRHRSSKEIKSFSHELGPRGGIVPSPSRAHSYNDITDLLGSLQLRFDAAKEMAKEKLSIFVGDVCHVLEQFDSSMIEDRKMAEDLLILAQFCMEMEGAQFRSSCETIVQDLSGKRQKCRSGILKWLFTQMLFILTHCARLLQCQKGEELVDEKTIHNLRKCLENVPAIEMNWAIQHDINDPDLDSEQYGSSDDIVKGECLTFEHKSHSQGFEEDTFSQMQEFRHADKTFTGNCYDYGQSLDDSSNDQERVLDGSGSVLCRICEEVVPLSCLESHSYICAYVDKCDQNCVDVDDCLSHLSEIIEHIADLSSLNSSSDAILENTKIQSTSCVTTDGYSLGIREWRNKSVDGIFEDIHEMDTAFIDDGCLLSTNLKSHLALKFCKNYGASSSTGSMTSVSSTNTLKIGHSETTWTILNNHSELEEYQQMIDLATIARSVASINISNEGSNELLLLCMQDLQDVLQQSKLKALVIDTFGHRIEKLLREKYMRLCDLQEVKSPTTYANLKDNSRLILDVGSQNSAGSTPGPSSHRERTSIDDFNIIKPISKGAFGKVFLARKRTTGDLFAIKVLKKLDMLRKNQVQRILAERKILITVRNPFVVRFYYSFASRDNLFLVMEYLSGGDLYSLLRTVGCLEEGVARVYISELVLALEYLHSLGIVHRDLKPDNILIAHDGHLKLTDFGLSKIGLMNRELDISGQEPDESIPFGTYNKSPETSRHRNSAVGTPDYLAPEILLGTEHGYAADWWSVGIIFFELLTGNPPFTSERPEIIFENILNKRIPWPTDPGYISSDAKDLINRLLVHEPDKRLGANGSLEVKSHSFFKGVDWDNLTLQKAVFVPNLETADDTSYFVSRFSNVHCSKSNNRSNFDANDFDSDSDIEAEVDESQFLPDIDSTPFDLSLLNFSFKNLSQLASINRDVLLQCVKESTKHS